MNTPHVVIIGAGFGGFNVARQLRNARSQITLIDKHNYHLFQPLLYQVAIQQGRVTAGTSSESSTVRDPKRFHTKTQACLPPSDAMRRWRAFGACRSVDPSPAFDPGTKRVIHGGKVEFLKTNMD